MSMSASSFGFDILEDGMLAPFKSRFVSLEVVENTSKIGLSCGGVTQASVIHA